METNEQIQSFCRRYFQAVHAPILVDQPDILQVELPREIDKELTDRPYYWMYVEATGQEVPNTVLTLTFSPEAELEGADKHEFVTLGSFRLNKLIESTQKRGRITRAYQSNAPVSSSLSPVLLTTFKISFVADRRRDEIVSYAVNLRSEHVKRDFYDRVESLPFEREPSPYVTTLAPILDFRQGYHLIRKAVEQDLEQLDHTWAIEAHQHLEQELEQLETYYQSLGLVNADEAGKTDEEKEKKAALYAAEKELREAELRWRCAPRVQIEPFHFALLFVADHVWSGTANTGNRLSM